MQKIRVQDAVGAILAHDITKIVPGEFKGVAFKKGHQVRAEDIPLLQDLGKEHIFVWQDEVGLLHENEAARRIAMACAGEGITLTGAIEGKINFLARERSLLKVNVPALHSVNSVPEVIVATRHTNQVVQAGTVLAGTRVIPLVIPLARIALVEELCSRQGPVLWTKPLLRKTVGLVTTGNEVYHGRIVDKFGPVMSAKMAAFDCPMLPQIMVPDDSEIIAQKILSLIHEGAEIVAVSGGMSVDPDDVTPRGISLAGAELISYGAPVLPGSMFLMAYLGDVPIVGLPGCVMYCATTILDLFLPRLLAGERVSHDDFVALGHGGLCLACEVCRYPVCPFGK